MDLRFQRGTKLSRTWRSICCRAPQCRQYHAHPTSNRPKLSLRTKTTVCLVTAAATTLATITICRPKVNSFSNNLNPYLIHSESSEDASFWAKRIPFVGNRKHNQSGETNSEDQPSHTEAGQQEPPSQTIIVGEGQDTGNGPEPESKLGPRSTFIPSLEVPSIEWSTIGDRITDFIIPEWARLLPGYFSKLQDELSMAPGSLAQEVWWEANDPEVNPEILWDASVRISDDICDDEKRFRRARKSFTRCGLAKYLDIPEDEIHPDDVPVIAMCGSGGGLRALVSGASSYLSAKEAGLFDCITYTAGVSGSCWLQTLYYSSLAMQDHGRLINHLKNRLGVHIAYPPSALALISSAPTNKFLLSGIVEKAKGVPDATFGIVDLYGLLLAARLLVPKGELSIDDRDLKVSNQRRFIDNGSNPLPIYTAIRHEIPIEEQEDKGPISATIEAKKEAWFQWFEFTPYEFWCEELNAGIPTWAVGRKFLNGKTVWRSNDLALPEVRTPLLMGIWGSAFCATLSHYYKEVQPLLQGYLGFVGIDEMLSERDEQLIKMHPIDPAAIPNFALGLKEQLPQSVPASIYSNSHFQLMDAGMSNNLPIYPLLRPGRDVDILIAFDVSADVRTDNWLKVADGYARQRGIKGWPIGSGWPTDTETTEQIADELDSAQAATPEEAAQRIGDAQTAQETQEQAAQDRAAQDQATLAHVLPQPEDAAQKEKMQKKASDLGFCTVWVGTTEERTSDDEPPQSKRVEEDWELMQPDAGITVIYFPFLSNPTIPDIDPQTSDYMSTWNFVYTPEQVDKVVALARANFEEGKEQTKRAVRAVYERKRTKRLEREEEQRRRRKQWKMRLGLVGKTLGEGGQGDHFS